MPPFPETRYAKQCARWGSLIPRTDAAVRKKCFPTGVALAGAHAREGSLEAEQAGLASGYTTKPSVAAGAAAFGVQIGAHVAVRSGERRDGSGIGASRMVAGSRAHANATTV